MLIWNSGLHGPPHKETSSDAFYERLPDNPIELCKARSYLAKTFGARALCFGMLVIVVQPFGKQVMQIAQSAPFRRSMMILIAVCVLGSALFIRKCLKNRRQRAI